MARKRQAPARLRDIAAMAGVSVNTVSRALNDKPDVSPRTRTRVRSIAERLGYSRNLLARSLASGRTTTLGLVVTDCTDPYYATLIRAVEKETSRMGFGLLLVTSNEDPAKERQGLALLQGRRVDGILLTAVDVEAPHVRRLLDQPVPTVLLSRRPKDHAGAFVGVDNFVGARLAVGHLCDLGHRRIAHIGRAGRASSGRERRAGVLRELKSRRLAAGVKSARLAAPTIEGGRASAPWFLALDPRPSAIVTYNDLQAIGIMIELRAAGLAVPEAVSVIGFDDIAMASLVEPSLTTVAQPIEDIGTLGAEMIIDWVQNDRAGGDAVVLPARLVLRRSTAPPS